MGDELELLKDGTHGTHKDVEYGPYLLSAKNVKNGKILIDDTDRKISKDEYEKIHKNFQLKKGDILLTIVGSIGETAILESPENITFQRSVAYLRPKEIISEYLYTLIRGNNFKNELKKRQVVSAQPGIYLGDLYIIDISIPELEEQKLIGILFKQLDNLITLQQRELDLMKKQKKTLLSKIFTRIGEQFPEIRFKGFTDPWEQRKLKEVLNEFTVKSKIENEYTVLSSTNAGMEKRNGRVSGGSNKGYKIISNGDLVLSPQNLWLGNININEIGKGLVSPSYKTFKIVNLHSDFLKPQLRQKKMLDKYKNASTQGASIVRRNLDIEDFNEISIDIPFEAEQVKIGSFFKQLDNLITLQQCEPYLILT